MRIPGLIHAVILIDSNQWRAMLEVLPLVSVKFPSSSTYQNRHAHVSMTLIAMEQELTPETLEYLADQ